MNKNIKKKYKDFSLGIRNENSHTSNIFIVSFNIAHVIWLDFKILSVLRNICDGPKVSEKSIQRNKYMEKERQCKIVTRSGTKQASLL